MLKYGSHIEFVTFEPTPLIDVVFPNMAATKRKTNQPAKYFKVMAEDGKATPVPNFIDNTVYRCMGVYRFFNGRALNFLGVFQK